jgi:hypothetical protein
VISGPKPGSHAQRRSDGRSGDRKAIGQVSYCTKWKPRRDMVLCHTDNANSVPELLETPSKIWGVPQARRDDKKVTHLDHLSASRIVSQRSS